MKDHTDMMRIDELDIPDDVSEALLSSGFRELHPPQAEAIPIALNGKNLVAAIPTASGKSLIGMIPALKILSEKRGKVLYIVPLKALASEKRDDFQIFADKLGFKVHMSTGDLDSNDSGLSDADVIVATSEKTDSLLRHGNKWIDGVSLTIADEIHMIHEPGRGPTLEIALTKMRRKLPEMQIIALSATISNAYDLAHWLDASLVKSDWRPVPLREGIYLNKEITFDDGSKREVSPNGDDLESLVTQVVEDGGQCIIFVNSRRSTESVAVRLTKPLKKIASRTLTKQERSALEGDAEVTDMGKKLSSCIEAGSSFHNAGLSYRQRKTVEDMFKAGTIKCIVATPTLAAGINLPARRVIIRDTTRFEKGTNVPISVMEIKQMCGRAGRPGYDPYGEAILVAKNQKDSDHLLQDYIKHDTERVQSSLFSGNSIKGHVLGILATGDADDEQSLIDFMRDTFYGSTSQMFGIERVVEEIVDYLVKERMVERVGDKIEILPFGKRVSDLYIEPQSASMLRDAIMKMEETTTDLQILVAAAMTPDVIGMYPKKDDTERLRATWEEIGEEILLDPYEMDDYMSDLFDGDLKVALLIDDWISEVPEGSITASMGIGPGDIRNRIDMMDWIIYAMSEIAYIFKPEIVRMIRPLSTRIRYGVREELIDLVNLRGIGRTRARILYDNGYRTRMDVETADTHALASIPGIGSVLAEKLTTNSGGHISTHPSNIDTIMDEMAAMYEEEENKKNETGPKQSSLMDF